MRLMVRIAALLALFAFIPFSSQSASAFSNTETGRNTSTTLAQTGPRASLVVTSLNDSGPGTLREAIINANVTSDADTITFAVTGEITLASSLPTIIEPLSVVGPGASQLTIKAFPPGSFTAFPPSAVAESLSISGMTLTGLNHGVYSLSSPDVTLSDMLISSMNSRAITQSGNTLDMTRVTVTGNVGARAVYTSNATVTITDSTIRNSGNIGMEVSGGDVTITGSTFANNTASGGAGAIYANGSAATTTVNITNSTFSGNSSTNANNADAIFAHQDATVSISFSTFSGHENSTTGSNTGVVHAGTNADIVLRASIIANNPASGTPRECTAAGGASFTASDNLTNDTVCPGRIGSPTNVSATLADNGGPTQTHALLAGSNAIDAYTGADCPATDQRGEARPAADTDCDLGAYEIPSAPVCPTSPATIPAADVAALIFAIECANASASDDVINLTNSIYTLVALNTNQTGLPPVDSTATAGTLTINGNGATISGNNQWRPLWVRTNANVALNNLTLSGGYVTVSGGAILNNGTLTLTGSTVSDSTATGTGGGGGIYSTGMVTLIGSTISGNTALSGSGGGINNLSGTLTLIDSTVSDNETTDQGGGIRSVGTLTVTGSTISGNTAGSAGGGISGSGTLTLTNSTISGNTAPIGGGITSTATLTLNNVTVSGNTASGSGDGIYNQNILTLNNTILANSGEDCFSVSGTVDANYTLFSNTNACGAVNGVDGNIVGADPMLGTLATAPNGTSYYPLLAGSPAINSGSDALVPADLDFDQAGNVRIQGGTVDMGSFETDTPAPVCTPGVPYTIPAGDVDALILAIECANASLSDDVINLTNSTYTLTATHNTSSGDNGLPRIVSAATAGTLTINGGGATISGNDERRVLYVNSGANVTLDDLTITAGHVPTASIFGGGIINYGTLTLNGGGVSASSAGRGGGIMNYGTLTLNGSVFADNEALVHGGGVFNNGNMTVTGSTFSGNTTGSDGGAIHGQGALTVTDSIFSGNSSTDGHGGAIYSTNLLNISGSRFTDNTATYGGGVSLMGTGFTAEIADALFTTNTASVGGGVYTSISGARTLLLMNSTIYDNTATSNGGGLLSIGTATVTNTTIANNSANRYAGIYSSGIMTVNNSTIVANTATDIRDGVYLGGGTLTLNNTILANGDEDCVIDTGTVDANYTLFSNTTACGAVNGVDGNIVGVSPMFGALATAPNGTSYYPLNFASPAIDAGSDALIPVGVTTDQAGNNRIRQTRVDMGAYESDFVGCPAFPATIPAGDTAALIFAIECANALPSDDVINLTSSTYTLTATHNTASGANGLPQIASAAAAGTLTINGSGATISGNDERRVIYSLAGANLTLNNLTISDGYVTSNGGGGIYNTGTLTLTDSTVSGNSASYGGGIYNTGMLTLTGSTASGNTATGSGGGGGIYTSTPASTLNLIDSTVSGNTTTYFNNSNGGGIVAAGTVTLTDSSVSGNTANASGGGIFGNPTLMTLNNSTVSGNTANDSGGGFFSQGTVILNNSTVTGNTAVSSGGGFYNSGTLTVNNTILAINTPFDCVASGSSIAITMRHALIMQQHSCGVVNGMDGNLVGVDPMLGTLTTAPNGTSYYPLLVGSPAINSGDNALVPVGLDFDQAGNPRIQGGTVDMGAFETDTPAPAPEINITGNSATIADGDATPDLADHTDFGATIVGTPVTRTFTIENTGNAALTISSIVLPSGFAEAAPSPALSVAAGSSTTLNVECEALAFGVYSGDVVINSDDADEDPYAFTITCQVDHAVPAGITIAETAGSTSVTESGAFDIYTIVLDRQPSANVTVTLTFDGQITADGSASPVVLTFTPANWATAQDVTVAAVNDSSVEGPHSAAISYTVASADADYNALTLTDTAVSITDNDTASFVFSSSTGSVSEADSPYLATVVLTIDSQPAGGTLGSAVSVDLNYSAGTATVGDDFALNTSNIGFDAGSSSGASELVDVSIVDDAISEPDETFMILFGAATGPATASGMHTVTILDDDEYGITISETTGSTAVTESGDTDTYTVALDSQPTADVTVTLTFNGQLTADGSASPVVLTFTPANWATAQDVTVAAVNDSLVEGAHSAVISQMVSSGDADYNAISLADISVNIADNDTAEVIFPASAADVSEDATPYSQNAVLSITSDPAGGTLVGAVTVQLTQAAGTALTPADYTLTTSSLTFPAGSASGATQPFSVDIVDDALDELDETFVVGFGAITGTATATGTHTVTILDDDIAGITVTETAGSTAVTESGDTDTYTVALDSQPTAEVTVTLTFDGQLTADGSASPVVLTFTPLNWATAQDVTVAAVNDSLVEGAHSAVISQMVSSGDADYNAISLADISVSITDNDTAEVTFAASADDTAEDATPYSQNAVLSITSDPAGGTLAGAVTVQLTQTPGTALTPDDYALTTASLTFPAGSASGATQPFSVDIVDDALEEADETFVVGFGAITGTATATGTHTVTILANDAPVCPSSPVTIPAGDVPALIFAIECANASSSDDVIELTGNSTYTLTANHNTTNGPNGLPQIASAATAGTLTINGNGAAIDGNDQRRVLSILSGANVTLNDVSIANGLAGNGAGIRNYGTTRLNRSTIRDNTATSDGGGIFNGGNLTVVNSTITGNTSSASGGGIVNLSGASLTVKNSTISANAASSSGGGGLGAFGTETVHNTIIFNNNAPGSPNPDCTGSINNVSHSMFQFGTCGAVHGSSGNLVGTGPGLTLVTPADGSPAYYTINASGVAVNAGSNTLIPAGVTTDQPGNPRVQGITVDIGSYEVYAPPCPVSGDTIPAGDEDMLIYAIECANASPEDEIFELTNSTYTLTEAYIFSSGLPRINDAAVSGTLTINGNGATISGGETVRIFEVSSGGDLTLNNMTLTDGRVTGINSGGAITVPASTSKLALNGVTIADSSAGDRGGAIYNFGEIVVSDSVFTGNTAADGGAIYNARTATITGSTISGNNATTGGGIYDSGSGLNITDSTISNNISTGNGGGFYVGSGQVELYSSSISGNTAESGGAGMYLVNATDVDVVNSTMTDNTATFNGGAVFIQSANSGLTLVNSTVALNGANNGAGIFMNNGSLTARNSILAGNNSTTGVDADCYRLAGTNSSSHSLYQNGSCSAVNGVSGNIVGANPLLGTLTTAPNGTEYYPLLVGSPAINAGDNAMVTVSMTTDQAGNDRIQGGTVDMGAFETDTPAFVPDIEVSGNGVSIANGDATPDLADHTDFGTTLDGTPVVRTFTIENSGTGTLSMSSITLPSGFSGTGTPPTMNLTAGQSTTLDVQCNAGGPGSYTGTVLIESNDADEGSFTFAITCQVDPLVPEINITGNGVSIANGDATPDLNDHTDFGAMLVGAPLTRAFTIHNTGTGTLTIDSFTLPSGFVEAAPAPSIAIPAGGSTMLNVQCEATWADTYSGTITINTNDADESPYTFAITCQVDALVPEINITGNSVNIADGDNTPSTLDHTDFGTTSAGTPLTRTFTIENGGTGDLNLSGVTLPSGFSIVPPLPEPVVAAGGSTALNVQCDAGTAGIYLGTVTVASDDADENPYRFDIACMVNGPEIELFNGIENILSGDLTPSLIDGTDFGTTVTGTPVGELFSLVNTGNETLTLGTVNVPAGFSVVTQPSTTVLAGQSTSIAIECDAVTGGTFSGTVSLSNNDADENPFTFAITCTVLAPDMNITGNGVTIENGDLTPSLTDHTDFGVITVGVPVTRTFTIENTGSGPLNLTGFVTTLTGFSGAGDPPAFTIPAGGSTTFGLVCDAFAAGTYGGTFGYTSNDSDESPYIFAVTCQVDALTPDIRITGNGVIIASGDNTPDLADHTDFGATPLGTPFTRTYTIHNLGDADLHLTDLVLPSGFAPVMPGPDMTLAPGETTYLDLQCLAQAEGVVGGTVIIESDDPDTPAHSFAVTCQVNPGPPPDINITGNGITIANGDMTPDLADHTDFGVTTVGVPVGRTFTIENTGGGALNLTGIAGSVTGFTGAGDPPDFMIPAGGSTTFSLECEATAEGTYNGTFGFTTNDPDESPYIFAITCQVNPVIPAGITITETDGTTAVSEAGDSDTYSVLLDSQPAADVAVTLTFNSQITVDGSDSPVVLTFTPANWNVAQTVTVAAVNDALVEGPHNAAISYTVASADASYDGLSLTNTAAAIADNDTATVAFESVGGSISEAATPYTTNAVLTVVSDPAGGSLAGSASLLVHQTSGTAAEPDDYTLVDGLITFNPGAITGAAFPLTFNIVDDAIDEPDETIVMTFGGPTGPYLTGAGTHTVTILDDDTASVVVTETGGATAVAEAGSTDTYSVVLDSQSAADVAVTLAFNSQITVDGSASPVVLTFTPANWNVAQTVTVAAVNDALVEGPHNAAISYTVASADASYNGLSLTNTAVTITDNDTASIAFAVPTGSATEGASPYTVSAVLSIVSDPAGGTLAAPVTVALLQTPGTAATPDDYTLTTTSLTFPAGAINGSTQMLEAAIVDDAITEANETFVMDFGTVTGHATASGTHTVTILASDAPVCPTSPATIPAGDVDALIFAIECANASPTDDVINLTSSTYTLTANYNYDNGLAAMADVATAGTLTINGNGATLSGNNQRRVLFVNGNANLTLNGLTITAGRADLIGGGIHNGGTLTITNSTVSGNTADYGGGGIINTGGMLTITNSTISNNTATFGGGINNNSGTLTITNSTISNNTAIFGGGIYNNPGTLTITNSTIANNTTTSSGGTYQNSGTLTITNSIFADGLDCQINSGTVAASHTLFSDAGACGVVDGVDGNLVGVDPLLGALTGSPAYHPLLAGSPAINSGSNALVPVGLDFDQAGNARIQGATVDMGSFETNTPAPAVVITETDGATSVSEAGGTDSYTVALTAAPSADVTVTLTFNNQITVDGSASPVVLTFNSTTPQIVTVAAVNDSLVEGPHSAAISYTVASADARYNGFTLADTVVAIVDDDPAGNLLQNPGFETAGTGITKAAKWGSTILTKYDKRVCNKELKTFSYSGNCAFRFQHNGVLTVSRVIKQTVINPSRGVIGENYTLDAMISADGLSSGAKLVLLVKYGNGTKAKSVITVPSGTYGYTAVHTSLPITRNVAWVRAVLRGGTASGRLLIDDLILWVEPGTPATAARSSDALLPLPPPSAPDGFRGSN